MYLATSRRYKMKYDAPSNPIVRFGMFVLSRMGNVCHLNGSSRDMIRYPVNIMEEVNPAEYYLLTNASATFILIAFYKKEWYKTRTELPVSKRRNSMFRVIMMNLLEIIMEIICSFLLRRIDS